MQLIGSRRLSTELGDIVEEVNRAHETPLTLDYARDANAEPHQYYCRSDHYMYARYGIPITFFFDGGHADYHQVTDEAQYIDYLHYARIVQLIHDIAMKLANLGWKQALSESGPLRKGLNIVDGQVVYPAVAEAFALPLRSVDSYLT